MSEPFTQEQLDALKQLDALWSPRTRFVLIGASAIRCHLPMLRETKDIDITVAVSMSEYPGRLLALPGWTQTRGREHEWTGPGRVRFDLLPAGDDVMRQGWIDWPSGHRMNVTGLAHAFARSATKQLAADLSVEVAELPVIALLKMTAYQDRPGERERDLADLALILEEYVGPVDDRRWSDEMADVEPDLVSPFALGTDLGIFLLPDERALVGRFLEVVEANRYGALVRMADRGPPGWRKDEDVVVARLAAFRRGLDGAVV